MAGFFGIEGWYHKAIEALSGGQRQMLNLASVMVMNPKVLILDEPTSQLDPVSAGNFIGMLEKLNWFPEYTKQRLGQVEVTNEGERFCFHIPEEGVEYVHEQMKENEFIKELIGLLQKHDCTMEEIFDLFRSHSEKVEIHEMDNGEFDYRVSFADDPEDSYIYCFKDEGCHIIYHRFLPEDYADFAF